MMAWVPQKAGTRNLELLFHKPGSDDDLTRPIGKEAQDLQEDFTVLEEIS